MIQTQKSKDMQLSSYDGTGQYHDNTEYAIHYHTFTTVVFRGGWL